MYLIVKVSKTLFWLLDGVFELAWRNSSELAKIQAIAEAQGMPARFLEVILSEFKSGGFVESRRGKSGGYLLARDPADLAENDKIEFLYFMGGGQCR